MSWDGGYGFSPLCSMMLDADVIRSFDLWTCRKEEFENFLLKCAKRLKTERKNHEPVADDGKGKG